MTNMTREHAKKILTHLRNGKSDLMLMDALDMAISALSENKGKWILVVDSYYEDGTPYESHWECSKCGSGRSGWGEFKFCPDCGADMTPVPYKPINEK